uniref:Copia protein n=1 Tax=Tanacetum cinerariifolium TaxID=118510 RepID=A0A6L2KLX1_TANCI|nr:copia protein [Tanacetum cinerariifolium]
MFMPRKKFHVLAQHLQEVMEESLTKMVDDPDVAKMIANAIQQECENLRAEISLQINNAITNYIPSQVHLRDHNDPYDDAHPEGENSAKRQKMSEHGTYVFGELSSVQDNKSKPGPSTSGNQEQLDDFDFLIDSYATDDDDLPTKKVSQELVEEMSQTVDEANLHKKRNSGPEKILLSLQKFLVIVFPDDDIKERTSRWVNKCVKNFNPYARYSVKHWKNSHTKIFYIKRQKELGMPKEEVYLNLKIVQFIKIYSKLGHKHKFVTDIIARANGSIVLITEPDYKNLNKNDIEDMYLLCIYDKVEDYAQTGLLWSFKEDDEYLQLFEEELEERLKHHDQIRSKARPNKMLKKFGLEDSKPMKIPRSSNAKLTKDEEYESVDTTKYRGMIGNTHLGLWYPKGTDIETIVYADSDHAGDYVDRKSTSDTCTFVGCCLTSWFSKKQTALAISTTEDEYVLELEWHLEEMHRTWAHLENKWTRLQTCTKIHQEILFSERRDGITCIKQCRCDLSGDDV